MTSSTSLNTSMIEKLIKPEFEMRDNLVASSLAKIASDAMKTTGSLTNRTRLLFIEEAASEIEIRIGLTYTNAMRVAATCQQAVTEQYKVECMNFIRSVGTSQMDDLKEVLVQTPPFLKLGDDLHGRVDFTRIDTRANNAYERIEADIELAILGSSAKPQTNPSSVPAYNFIGNNGNIVIGNHNVANLTQHITNEDKSKLTKVLSELKSSLNERNLSGLHGSQADLVESIETCENQLSKNQPNYGLLKAGFSTVVQSISAVADLQNAYNNLKTIGSSILGVF